MALTEAKKKQLISQLGFSSPAAFEQEWERLSEPEREQVLALAATPTRKPRARREPPPVQPVTVTRRAPAKPKTVSTGTNPAVPATVFQSF